MTELVALTKDFKVAIVGGGMCGLLCAVVLMKAGIHVELFEQAAKFEEIGAGLSLGPNALFALEQLGVLEAVYKQVGEYKPAQPPMEFVSGMGENKTIYDYPYTEDDLGLGIYRPTFLEALIPKLHSSRLHFHHRCISVTSTLPGSHLLHFEGGNTFEADLVVGADGIRSVVRDFVTEVPTPPVYSNTDAYRGVVATEIIEKAGVNTNFTKNRILCWVGRDKHLITYPIQGGKLMNIVAFSTDSTVPIGSNQLPSPWVKSVTEEGLLNDFVGWGSDAITMLQQIKKPRKWSVHLLYPPLNTYVRQKVVLVGDSAHGMVPHLGAGVGQGCEDALVLCKLLMDSRTQSHNLDSVLKAYDRVRVPRASMVHERSILAGDLYEGRGKFGDTAQATKKQLEGMWDPIWYHNLSQDLEHAAKDAFGTKE